MSLTYSPKIVTDGLLLYLNPSQNKSYPATDLPMKNGLIMWMDAADDSTFSYSTGTTVSQWRDKSGYNYHMVPVSAGPTRNAFLNSRKVLAFTTGQDIQNLFIDLRNSPYTVFIVSRYTSPSAGTGRILTSNSSYNNWLLGHWASETNKYYANGWVYSTYVALDTNWKLYLGDWGGPSNDLANFYGAGTAIATNSADASAGPWTLGINAYSGEKSNCEVAEIVIFNRLLSTSERRLVHTYLGQKWGILNTDRSIIDLSGNQKDSLLGNGTTTYMPKFDYDNKGTLFFDDSDDTLLTNIPITSTPALSNFTYEIWTKLTNFPTVAPANGYGVTYRAGFLMGASYYGGAGLIWYGANDGLSCTLYGFIRGTDAYRSTSGYSLSLNQYYHLVLVNNYGANKLQLFVNGVLYNETSTATAEYDAGNAAAAGNIGIAKAQIDGGGTANYSHYAGRVGLARIYSRALSANEILQNYEAQKKRFADTLIVQGLVLNLDAGNPYSYAGAGTTWYDTSGNAINANATGSPTYSTLSNGIISFPTTVSSYYNTATVSTFNLGAASFSMEAWVYLDVGTGTDNVYRGIISLGIDSANFVYIAKWRSGLYSGLYVQYKAGGSTITGVYQGNDYNPVSRWTHVVATKSSNVLYFYVNGTLYSTASNLNTTFTGNSSVYIGQAHSDVASMYGYMGEARAYNISLSAAQVLQNYNATKGRYGL